MEKQGNIKISSENMMPIIKKWLYPDKDIFLREIVSNGVDAITKFKKLVNMGEAEKVDDEFCIKISIDKDKKTLTVSDNGIGMTADEVEKYITQIAFSGASDFVSKYEKAGGDGIIGHFGLGFYSAYMVSDDIEILTKSYTDAPAVCWESDGNATYTIADCDKKDRGTDIIMHLSENEKEFLDESEIISLIKKYCGFMPVNIYFAFKGDGTDKPLNDTTPLYAKNPKDCTDEEYKEFYKKTFFDYNEPLFWVHLNMDYPFNLKGILYFPKVRNKVELERGMVKLYCNQVFIADNIKEVIPEFLMLLNGVIDCPDIPLNVSRSFLQNDRQVQKISKHITKKVADKLNELYKNDREQYIKCWSDISTFVKFGCLKDEEFYDKIKDVVIFKDINGDYKTINDLVNKTSENSDNENAENKLQENENNADGDKKTEEVKKSTIYYISDEKTQSGYIKMFKDANLPAVYCDSFIDPHFISFLEYKLAKDDCKFIRIDADVDNALKSDTKTENAEDIIKIFKDNLVNKNIEVKLENLKSDKIPAIVNVSEYGRRYSEMSASYGMETVNTDDGVVLVLNGTCPVVSSISALNDESKKLTVNQVYYLAMLNNRKLNSEEMDDFMQISVKLLSELK